MVAVCPKDQLLASYTTALTVFHNVQAPLLRGLRPGEPGYDDVVREKEVAYATLLRARRQYWAHVDLHGCRHTIGA